MVDILHRQLIFEVHYEVTKNSFFFQKTSPYFNAKK